MSRTTDRWNHNIHYHPILLGAVPAGAARALDVGSGEGMLARELRLAVTEVVAIDIDEASIDLARPGDPGCDITFVAGDFMTHPFEPESFDVVTSVAALHHMDAASALAKMRDVLKPGGTLAILGCMRRRLPVELPYEAAAFAANLPYRFTKTYWEHSAPKLWPPPETYPAMRSIAGYVLPGMRIRRHLLWRYSIVWTKPAP